MATLKWGSAGNSTGDISDGNLEGLADGAECAPIDYDNSTNLNLYAIASIYINEPISWAPGSDPYVLLRVNAEDGANTPNDGPGDLYRLDMREGTGTKILDVNKIRLYPFEMLFYITNHTGVALPSGTGETGFELIPYSLASS